MVRLDGVHHVRRLPKLLGELRPDDRVGAFDLVADRLAHVVQEAAPARQPLVQPQLGGEHPAHRPGLLAVGQDVLPVARPVA